MLLVGDQLQGFANLEHLRHGVVALADMPFVRRTTIAAVRGPLAAGAPLVAPYFRARRGHPVGFSGKFKNQLLALQGDEGAKKLLAAHEDYPRHRHARRPGATA